MNNLIKDKEGNVVEAGFIYPSTWDIHKSNVKAYKGKDGGGAEYCIVECSDDEYTEELLKDKNVTELTKEDAESNISTIRVKPDVMITLLPTATEKISTIKTDIENLLKNKGLKYDIT